MKQVIWVYALCYNESHFVKNFLVAYKDADKIIINDNMSTDNSVELLKEDPRVEVRSYDSGGKIRDDIYIEFKNNVWKEARGKADWVIVVDFDEVFTRAVELEDGALFDLDLIEPYENGFNIIKPYGYNMIAPEAELYTDVHPHEHANKGAYHVPQEKMVCFRPDQISEINFGAGAHLASPLDMNGSTDGVKVLFDKKYKLLHYKFWNTDFYMKRMKMLTERISQQNKEHGWGFHYMIPLEDQLMALERGIAISEPLFEIKSPYEYE